jgi:hypothetical protein
MSHRLRTLSALRQGSVRLVPPNHNGYRRWASEMRTRKQALRGRGFGPSAADRLPYVLEAAARHWLGSRLELLDERIVSYEISKGRYYEPAYRELDIVCGRQRTPELVIEVKSGRSRSVLAEARAQLAASTALLQTAWPRVRSAVLLLRGDDAPPLEVSPMIEVLHQPGELLQAASGERLACLLVDARSMFDYALEHGLCGEPDLYEQAAAVRAAAASVESAASVEVAPLSEFGSMAQALLRWQQIA